LALAYFFLSAWTKSELVQTQLQANQLSTEIKFLKSQITPHFLFNTLNNLFSMAQAKENDELADGISKLSGMMRYMLYDSNAERVPLSKEISYLKECITLNKLRYADEEVLVTFDQGGPIGLENVRRRLELVYPGKHRLIIKKEDGKFMVNLEIDLS
jgi:LytS/YehU family sensor histidine kinase